MDWVCDGPYCRQRPRPAGYQHRATRARLGILARDGVLLGASEEAYGEGITGLVQLAGPAAGLTRLARVGLKTWRKQIAAPISRCSGKPSQLTASCSRPWMPT